MYVQMLYHGGNCCGMTHLYLSSINDPNTQLGAGGKKFDANDLRNTAPAASVLVQVTEAQKLASGLPYTCTYGYKTPAASLDRPPETIGERVTALVEQMKAVRSHGIIESVLTNKQLPLWGPFLETLGFKAVGEALNSNSMNRITVYLLLY